MKLIVKTTGSFSLYDPHTGDAAEAGGPALVRESHFVSERAALGQLKILGQVSDEATKEEFEKYRSETKGDEELLVESFTSAFPLDGKPPPPPSPPEDDLFETRPKGRK